LRRLAAAAALAALTAFGVSAPTSAAVPVSNAKVVIIVGATEGTTSTYRSYADQAYAEAIKYTSRVTKVYSPNATWSKVKAAAAGANILLYYGHGNGWPSPYPYDPQYTTKDGMGLNDPTHLSDSVHKYYGEPSMAQLGLAPNAIVLLGNLCYASGNSEPGGTAPSVSVARQRIDNYSAGFLKGGARAVIADGHGGLISYIRGLFTSSRTIVDLWRSVPDFHGHATAFASTRSPGYTAYSDPDTTSGGYYRSLVTKPTITTTAVINAAGDTGVDPATLAVPGRAQVAAAGTPLLASATVAALQAAATDGTPDVPAGTRLKTLAVGLAATASTPALIQVQGLDDPSITGFVPADHLTPRDSRAPVVIGIDSGIGRFSPNGDGVADTIAVDTLFSEPVSWTFEVRDGDGTVLATSTGTGREPIVTWDGATGGNRVADGTYTWTARGGDTWQNGTATATGSLVVDTTAPSITSISPDGSVVNQFSPNADGVADTITTTATPTEAGSIAVRVANAGNTTVRTFTVASTGAAAVTWDGKANGGTVVPDGEYTITMAARDTVGNSGPGKTRTVRVVTLLGSVAASARLFYPNDLDRFAPSTTLSFRLGRPATVTWTIRDAANHVVLTHLDGVSLPAGPQSWVFNGRRSDGTMLPPGTYTTWVQATDGTYSWIQAARVELDAFAVTPSTTTPKRGAKLTVTAVTAEPLSGGPQLYVTQPGLSTYVLRMSKVNSTTWRLTVTLKSGGTAGTLKLKVWAKDADGRTQATWKSLTLK
jgi:flagellar hook assembly protein FlgD